MIENILNIDSDYICSKDNVIFSFVFAVGGQDYWTQNGRCEVRLSESLWL